MELVDTSMVEFDVLMIFEIFAFLKENKNIFNSTIPSVKEKYT